MATHTPGPEKSFILAAAAAESDRYRPMFVTDANTTPPTVNYADEDDVDLVVGILQETGAIGDVVQLICYGFSKMRVGTGGTTAGSPQFPTDDGTGSSDSTAGNTRPFAQAMNDGAVGAIVECLLSQHLPVS